MSTTPKVSVCIPTYNTARYLPAALESVLRQDFHEFELVVCDDASTDNTAEIIESYQDSRIRYVRTQGKSGQSGIFNRCHQEARGEFVTILHADDLILPGFLSDRVRWLESSREFDFVFGAVETIDADGKRVSIGGRWSEDRIFRPGDLLEPMLHGCILCPPSLMIRSSCLRKVGPFNKDYTWGPDWEWDLRLAEQCGGCYTAKVLAAYRVHDASGTSEQLSAAKNGPQERRIINDAFARICAADPTRKKWKRPVYRGLSLRHMYFAQEALVAGRRKATRSNLWYAALAHKPMALKPTFWALWLASVSPFRLYALYQSARAGFCRGSRSANGI